MTALTAAERALDEYINPEGAGPQLYPAEIHGKLAGECAPLLAAAVTAMEADPAAYRELNPPNGWGDYDSLLRALKKLLKGFEGNPHMVVWISR